MNKILLAVAGGVLIFAGLVVAQPNQYRVERSIQIAANSTQVFFHLADLKNWQAWSPWYKRDPNMTIQWGPSTRGVGAYQTWQSKSEGNGKMTILAVTENQRLEFNLEFFEPFAGQAQSDFSLKSSGDNQTELIWGMDGYNDGFFAKLCYLFMDFDSMIGKDYDAGLTAIKQLAENAHPK